MRTLPATRKRFTVNAALSKDAYAYLREKVPEKTSGLGEYLSELLIERKTREDVKAKLREALDWV